MTVTIRLCTLAAASLCAACAPFRARTAAPVATLTGVVRDTSGAPLDQVSVRLRAPGDRVDLHCALSDSTGRYVFAGVAPGRYDVFLVVPPATELEGLDPRPVAVAAHQVSAVDFTVTLVPVSFARHVAPVLRGACTGCHSTAGGAPLGLRLTRYAARASTVGVPAVESPNMKRISAAKPDSSYLLYKLQGTHLAVGGSGVRMPQGFPPLPKQTIRMIGRWIAQGAPQN